MYAVPSGVPHKREVLEIEYKNDDLPPWDAELNDKSVDLKNNNLPQDPAANKKNKEVSDSSKTHNSEASSSKFYKNELMDTKIERILELSNKHMNENFKKKINEIYSLLYGDDLPEEWLDNLKFAVFIDQNDEKPKNLNENISTNSNKITSVNSNDVSTNLKLSNNINKVDENIHGNLEPNVNKTFNFKSSSASSDQSTLIAKKSRATENNESQNLNTLASIKSNKVCSTTNENTEEVSNLKSNIDQVITINIFQFLFVSLYFYIKYILIFFFQKPKKESLSDTFLQSIMNISPKSLNLDSLDKEFKVIIQSCKSLTEIWGNVDGEDYFVSSFNFDG